MAIKFVLTTTPIRPVPTSYPPVGSTSIIDYLIPYGYDPIFYDIDAFRPKFEEVVDFFRREQPDIWGISAVVSTAYRYVKEITHAVKKVSPNTKIILGGNMAASAEILHRKCPIDICVIGEGEKPTLNLLRYFEKYKNFEPTEELKAIKGITMIDTNNEFLFTGYEVAMEAAALRQPNFEILEKSSILDRFIHDPILSPNFVQDRRTFEPHRKGQKAAVLLTSKGCVARCTFCHRWDKGYRVRPVDHIINQIKYLKEKYNVGFLMNIDENFGSDIRQVNELIAAIKPLDVLFSVGGVRVASVFKNPQMIRELKEAGCVAMHFGMETGSPKMLGVMEKRASLEQNVHVAKKLNEEKMYTIIQLVIGMPGENDRTVQETIEFAKAATEDMDEPPVERLSINLFQALPGTPGYEYMRSRGLLGSTMEDEEKYLYTISDVDAASPEHYINISEEPMSRVLLWQKHILRETTIHYYKRRNWKVPKTKFLGHSIEKDYARGGYFRIVKMGMLNSMWYWRFEDIFRTPLYMIRHFKTRKQLYGLANAIKLSLGLMEDPDNREAFILPGETSLRQVVKTEDKKPTNISEFNMIPLRAGR
ncbi:MAG: radical SAM protein [Bdellovibrionales bacterium]